MFKGIAKPRPKCKPRNKDSMVYVNEKTKARLEKDVIDAAIKWRESIVELGRFPDSEIALGRQINCAYTLEDTVLALTDFNEHQKI